MDEDQKNQLFEQLFPLPNDLPRRKLRFGSLPAADRLPTTALSYDTAVPRAPFRKSWEDEALALRFRLREETDSGQVLALIEGDTEQHCGCSVSLALVGAEPHQQIRRKISLQKNDAGGCFGEARLGTIVELLESLGEEIRPTHFLIDERPE